MVCRDFCGRPVVETLHVREGHSGCPPPGDLPNPGIEPKSPILQVDSLPSDPSGKPMNTGAGSLSFFQEIFLTQELNQGLLHCRQILCQLSSQEACVTSTFSVSVGCLETGDNYRLSWGDCQN